MPQTSGDVLHLVLRLGADRYALDAAQVIEVVALVKLKALPGAPVGVAGIMNYRGDAVPVLDLELLATGVASPRVLETRIILVHYPPDDRALGLLVSEVGDTLRADPLRFEPAGVATEGTPFLGPILTTAEGVVQRVEVASLLTEELRTALFPAGAGP
jgi:chemotaxis-related protein WspB